MNLVNRLKVAGSVLTNKSFGSTDTAYFGVNGSEWSAATYGNTSREEMLKYFLTIPELFQVLALKAQMFSNGNFYTRNRITKEPTITPYSALLVKPNFHQGSREFFIQTSIFRDLYGNGYTHFNEPMGMPVNQMNALDPLNISIPRELSYDINTPLFRMAEMPEFEYIYKENGTSYLIPSTELMHINNPPANSNDFASSITGVSNIDALAQALNNIKGAYESKGQLIYERGALGILSNSSTDALGAAAPLDKTEKENVQGALSRKYGLLKGQWKTIVTNLSLKWQPIGTNMKDLMLFEEIEADFQLIIGGFGMERELFPNTKGATYENKREAQKSTYVNTIIPAANEFVSALNTKLGLDDTPNEIAVDYSHLEVFSDDLKNKGIALKNYIGALDIAFKSGALDLAKYKTEVNTMLDE